MKDIEKKNRYTTTLMLLQYDRNYCISPLFSSCIALRFSDLNKTEFM